jgi:hypothetical protein
MEGKATAATAGSKQKSLPLFAEPSPAQWAVPFQRHALGQNEKREVKSKTTTTKNKQG